MGLGESLGAGGIDVRHGYESDAARGRDRVGVAGAGAPGSVYDDPECFRWWNLY